MGPAPLTSSLTDTAAMLCNRELSPRELLDHTLARIEAVNDDLTAVVALRDRAELEAEGDAAAQRLADGTARPLEGIPIGIKDLEAVAGMVTTRGSKPFLDNLAPADEAQTARLREAGAIVVGKTNAPEFGYTGITKNLIYGTTRNPWDVRHTPGGSSGGSAAAIAGGLLPGATASDGGGSIRIPASFSGLYGLKPQFGRVPVGPQALWDFDETTAYGPLTRTVADAGLWLDATVGFHPSDPRSLPDTNVSYAAATSETAVSALADGRPLRIGFSASLGGAPVEPVVAAAVESAVQEFARLGHDVMRHDIPPPTMGPGWVLQSGFGYASELEALERMDQRDDFGRTFMTIVDRGAEMTPAMWGGLRKDRRATYDWMLAVFDEFDLLITPTTPHTAPPAAGPFPALIDGRQPAQAGVAAFTIPFNMTGNPAASLPVGFDDGGLPIGMQLVGPPHRDELVLTASAAFEQQRPWHGPDAPQHWPTTWQPLV